MELEHIESDPLHDYKHDPRLVDQIRRSVEMVSDLSSTPIYSKKN